MRREGHGRAGRGRGSIVTIASTYGVVAPDPRLYGRPEAEPSAWKPIDYPASKGAILAFTPAPAAATWAPECK
jgi:NAD(P)-dependent dehydrogenase (short-subunit alcohol dehydrogenase family)